MAGSRALVVGVLGRLRWPRLRRLTPCDGFRRARIGAPGGSSETGPVKTERAHGCALLLLRRGQIRSRRCPCPRMWEHTCHSPPRIILNRNGASRSPAKRGNLDRMSSLTSRRPKISISAVNLGRIAAITDNDTLAPGRVRVVADERATFRHLGQLSFHFSRFPFRRFDDRFPFHFRSLCIPTLGR